MSTCSARPPASTAGWPGGGGGATRPMARSGEAEVESSNKGRRSGARAKRASPESITTAGSMDSGPAPSGASRNDQRWVNAIQNALALRHRMLRLDRLDPIRKRIQDFVHHLAVLPSRTRRHVEGMIGALDTMQRR